MVTSYLHCLGGNLHCSLAQSGEFLAMLMPTGREDGCWANVVSGGSGIRRPSRDREQDAITVCQCRYLRAQTG